MGSSDDMQMTSIGPRVRAGRNGRAVHRWSQCPRDRRRARKSASFSHARAAATTLSPGKSASVGATVARNPSETSMLRDSSIRRTSSARPLIEPLASLGTQ